MEILRPPRSEEHKDYLKLIVDDSLDAIREYLRVAQQGAYAGAAESLVGQCLELVRIWSVIRPYSEFSKNYREPLLIAASAAAVALGSLNPQASQLALCGVPVNYQHAPNESTIYPGRWLEAFFLNLLVKDDAGLATLSRVDLHQLLQSSTQESEYVFRFADALQAYLRRDPNTAEKMQSALDATDPDRFDLFSPEHALWITVQHMNVFWNILAQDSDAYESAFAEALESHREFWTSTEDRDNDWDGYLSIELSALATLGKMRGLPLNVKSEYLLIDPLSAT